MAPRVQKKALVTGATRGLGLAIAKRLVHDGFDVIGTGRSKKTDLGFPIEPVDFDDENSFNAFLNRVIATQTFDVLVNNAGINKISPFAEVKREDFERIQRVNTLRPFQLCQAVVPRMRSQKWGRIVNVSSIFGTISKEHRASYSASKFALDGMTSALAVEVAKDNVLANCVAPGFIDTDLTREVLGPDGIAKLVERVPIGRLGNADEVAALVAWLVSDQNTLLTGQHIVIDGGFTRV